MIWSRSTVHKDLYQWHRWFAWKPVKVARFTGSTQGGFIEVATELIVWLQFIERSYINDEVAGDSYFVYRPKKRPR
jgi:hypothetical protein